VRRSPTVYFVDILSSLSGTLYVGISNNVQRRSAEHSIGQKGFVHSQYAVNRLVYFETFTAVVKSIALEKQIKSWQREKKIALIKCMNPSWRDLRKSLLETTL